MTKKEMLDEQMSMEDITPEYKAFVDKFKPAKTTDDCYTPPLVYDAVRDWACAEYEIDPDKIVRPFYPGGDYERFDYSDGRVVLDNPPFSILSKICKFYLARKIPFFLFAPSLTALNIATMETNHIIAEAKIVYENGAVVHTAFVTSYGGNIVAQTSPKLHDAITQAQKRIKNERSKIIPKYIYPDHVLTAAMLQKYSKYGIDYKVRRDDCVLIPALDAQRAAKKEIYGKGLLLSERAAAERAAAERAAAERAAAERAAAERAAAERAAAERAAAKRWELSAREKDIIKTIGQEATTHD